MALPRKWIRICPASSLVGLKGGACRIVAGGGVGGAYGDLTGAATRLTIMIYAVLYVTANTLDVITALLVVHSFVPSFGFCGMTAQVVCAGHASLMQ